MLKKVNITLGIIAVIGAMFLGGVLLWSNFSSPENHKVTQMIGG